MLPPRPHRSEVRGRALGPVGGLALALVLAACSGGGDSDEGPDPAAAATALAAALATGELSGAPLAEAEAAEAEAGYDALVEGMGDLEPDVELADVSRGTDGSAVAELAWTWPVAGREWSYTVEAPLTRVGEAWQVTWSPALVEPSLGADEVLDLTPVAAERGRVLGAGGRAIVTERPVVRFGIDRSQVPRRRAGASAAALARLVDVDVGPYVARVEAAGDRAFVEALVLRQNQVPPGLVDRVRGVPGGLTLPDDLPLAPTRDFAAELLGTVGEVTAEMIEEHPDRYRVGDTAGLSGLQARYDEQLQGRPGAVVEAVPTDPGSGGAERELHRVPARRGEPLRLTLDVGLQQRAEALLGDIGPGSALVALRPSTGGILAAANGPGTDGYNVATYGQLPPGSTFKTVTALALLRTGLTPGSPVSCPAEVVVDGKRFENYDGYPAAALGRIPLRTAVAQSCNTAMISAADRLERGDLADAAASLGLGVDHDLGFPAYFGSVPPPASDVELAADLIGQGTVLASPMVMAAVVGSVQQGALVVPRLVESVDVSAPADVQQLTRAEAEQLRSMLRAVVTEGSGRLLADVPGPPVIAKTGTAEFERDGELRTHAWMVAVQGDLAVAVYVELGESGSATAGPILEAFLRAAG